MKIIIIFFSFFSLIQSVPIDKIGIDDEIIIIIENITGTNNEQPNQRQETFFSELDENSKAITDPPITSLDAEYIKKILNIKSCGLRLNNDDEIIISLVINGKPSKPNSWPWMVGIYQHGKFICGGTIINAQYILTAAHCVSHRGPKEDLKVLIGAHRILPINHAANNNEENEIPQKKFQGIFIPVKKVISHENYTLVHKQNDIAILKLNQLLSFDQQKPRTNKTYFYQPICLPNNRINAKNLLELKSTIIGWGHEKEDGSISPILNEVQVPIISNEECLKAYANDSINHKQICAGDPNGGKDSCQGDSGGPLMIADYDDKYKSEIYYQLGIVSWGKGCGRPHYPGVYTRVSEYVDWILQQIQSN